MVHCFPLQAVLSPVVTILLSGWLLAEPVSNRLILGSALVLAGVSLGSLAQAAIPVPERTPVQRVEAPCEVC